MKPTEFVRPLRVCVLLLTLIASISVACGAQATRGKGSKPVAMMNWKRQNAMTSTVAFLKAGPIRCKFIDGELHYLYVGNKEIIRRIYFAVRDGNWNTPMPVFSQINIQQQTNSFTIDLAARCKSNVVDYTWRGHIEGTANGTITFHADGMGNEDFQSQRIGLCVLYGADSLAGQDFHTVSPTQQAGAGTFPPLVSPTLVAPNFVQLRYTTANGMQVTTQMDGTHFDMEDQRNYSDSSYKAYAPLAYNYPNIKAGVTMQQTLTVSLQNAPAVTDPYTTVRVTLGKAIPGSRVPNLVPVTTTMQDSIFINVNTNRAPYANANLITWGYNPAVHLPDNDNFMDNAMTALDQAKTSRAFAPHAAIHMEPIRLTTGTPRDPRNTTVFGAAWSARLLKYLSLGSVARASLDVGPGYAHTAQVLMGSYSGKPLLATTIDANGFAPLDAFAVQGSHGPVVWLVNLTDQPVALSLMGLPSNNAATLKRINDTIKPNGAPAISTAQPTNNALALTLRPYEVCEVLLTP